MLKIMPVLQRYRGRAQGDAIDGQIWTESDDIKLLEAVEAQELADADEPIDFNLANGRS